MPLSITQIAVPTHPGNSDVDEDEFGCLNLNVVRPSHIQGKIPVMVWIHGGAFSVGTNSEKVYDGVEFVSQSIKIGQPVIYVAINYRLGFFGFLASSELLEETNGKSVGNYGLWDQKAALEFVRDIIEAFGGDREEIPFHAKVQVQPFTAWPRPFVRAICESGVTNTLGPLPLRSVFHQGLYDEFQSHLGTQGLEQLRSTSPDNLVAPMQALYPDLPASFLVDDSDLKGGFYPAATRWNSVSNFCKALMIGYCTNEGVITATALATIGPEKLSRCLKNSGLSEETLQSYGLDDTGQKDFRAIVPGLIEFQSDLVFKGPTEAVIANAQADSLFVYRFERENKWSSSSFAGIAHHTIDLLYLAGLPLYYDTEDPATDKISEKMITAWIKFGNKSQPWPPYSENDTELVLGRDGSFLATEDRTKFHSAGLVNMQGEIASNPEAALRLNAVLSNGAIRS